jgi:trk system potassium uptake protein TrkA
VQNVVARNYDPSMRPLLEAFELQIISSSSWGAQRFEEMLYHAEMHTVFSAGNGEVEIYEFAVPLPWAGRPFSDLMDSGACVPVSITRNGAAMLPKGEIVLQENDYILVSATFDGIESLRKRLHNQAES